MISQRNVPEEIVNAVVDGEIDADEAGHLLQDPETARRIRELRQVSRDVRMAYEDVHVAPQLATKQIQRPILKLAATILVLSAGLLLGFFFRDLVAGPQKHLLLHVTDGSEVAMSAAMDSIERNLARGVSVDLVTQRRGIALVGVDSPIAARLSHLAATHDNFVIYACAGTLEKLRASGAAGGLIAATRTDTYAIDRVSHAYQHRWRYERI
ncbi:MAG: hypothetical protein OEQ74_08100 [Gammaproteobacteria bacterium]|nr:hypothetical protein [Gammaproteobacteria bacterium]